MAETFHDQNLDNDNKIESGKSDQAIPASQEQEEDLGLHDLEELMNDLEDGESIPEEELLWAVEHGIDSVKASKQALLELRKIHEPTVSVPAQYIDDLRASGQMKAQMAWDGIRAIRGSLVGPYQGHEDEPRTVFRVLPHVKLNPRFTFSKKYNKLGFFGIFEVDQLSLPLVIGKDIEEIK